ncbi:MAG: hypothetical protein KDB22_10610 [Planctomycetales bacterium]|nr:hypothetical protein [Planctomycetales bacterium]
MDTVSQAEARGISKAGNVAQDTSGMAFLEQLEAKHDQVLVDLDALNERIESVLAEYQQSRQTQQTQPTIASS